MTQTSRPWLLPLLAHLVLIASIPVWFITLVFSGLLLTGHDPGPPLAAYWLFALLWLTPATMAGLLLMLWHALYQRLAVRANRLATALLIIQIISLFWLLVTD
ncbi:hypothetical protein ABMA57_02440 [Saccharospirillum sp. HFRX-1]|uniref:hypothetical protein n=1 Tax=unclassified Saccharospirillum TaxID=2633430 RepID=UPI00371CFAC9